MASVYVFQSGVENLFKIGRTREALPKSLHRQPPPLNEVFSLF